jgi:hypothetical protein
MWPAQWFSRLARWAGWIGARRGEHGGKGEERGGADCCIFTSPLVILGGVVGD